MRKILTIPLSIIVGAIIISLAIYVGLQTGEDVEKSLLKESPLISLDEISEKVPQNYQIFDYDEIDLDGDGNDEIFVIIEEEEMLRADYIKETGSLDYFRVNPVKIMVLDYINDIWVKTESQIVSNTNGRIDGQYLFQPYNTQDPYIIISKSDKDWLVILTYHASFDGAGIRPGIFVYDELDGLIRVETSEELWGDIAFFKDDFLYFTICNPFVGGEVKIEAYELNLNGNIPKEKELSLSEKISCNFLWTNAGEKGFVQEQERTEKLFNSKGIYFPID